MKLSFADAMLYLTIGVYVIITVMIIACFLTLWKWYRFIRKLEDSNAKITQAAVDHNLEQP